MIVVVGAGITGLAIGRELAARGADFLVVEASGRVGGVIRSGEVDGRVLDWGPQRARLTPPFRALCTELGLDAERLDAPPGLGLFVYREGKLRTVPYSLRDALRTDAVGSRAKLRALLEPFTGGEDPGESVADYFTRKLGREIYESVVGPLFGGLYASDPAEMLVGITLEPVLRQAGVRRSLIAALVRSGGRIDPPPACSFRAGMQALPDALGARLGSRLRLGAPVVSLSPRGSGWRVALGSAGSHAEATEWVDARHVVLTLPATPAGRLLEPFAPDAARTIQGLRSNPLALVHLDADTALRGLGFQVAFTERDLLLRGVTYNESLFGRRRLYTAFLGGGRHPEVRDMDPETLAARAVDQFRRTTGYDARAISVDHTSIPAWDRSWQGLDRVTLPPGLFVAANWWSRAGLPGRFAEARRTADALSR